MIGKCIYRGDISEEQRVEIWPIKTGLGQGLRIDERLKEQGKIKNENHTKS
jgi:hypothetical protein